MVWAASWIPNLATRPGVPAPDDFSDRRRADDGDDVLLKVLLQLLGGEVHAVTHILVVWVVLLGDGEHLARVVDWALDGLDLALLWSLDHQHRANRPRGRGYVDQQWLLVGWRG